jgi:hypothetical protein
MQHSAPIKVAPAFNHSNPRYNLLRRCLNKLPVHSICDANFHPVEPRLIFDECVDRTVEGATPQGMSGVVVGVRYYYCSKATEGVDLGSKMKGQE